MKTFASVAAVLLLLGAGAAAQTLDDLKNDGKNTDNILTYGMGYHQRRHSPLNQINKQTVKRLVPVWNLSLDNDWGEQAQPIIYNGVMYVTNARHTVAIDASSGKQIWRHTLDWPPETPRVVCCGVSNKGAAIYNGRIYRTTLDAYLLALDAKTGKEVWKSKVAEWKDGFSLTLAPLVANGVIVIGNSGTGCAASLTDGIPRPASSSGATTPFRRAARRATRPGRRTTTPGNSAAARPGSPDPTILSST
jgi:alcohol dehydrogenase (cytochrome c)